MIRRLTIRGVKRSGDRVVEFPDGSVVLAGPSNAGKSAVLRSITAWKFGLDRWLDAHRRGTAAERSAVEILRSDFVAPHLREMNLM